MKKHTLLLPLIAFLCGMFFATGSAASQVKTAAPYKSPQKQMCNAEFEKDAVWQAEIKDRFRGDLHEEESASMLRNNKHVVAAYGVIWVMMLGFMLYMYFGQRGLSSEITRLESELKKAASS